MTSPALSKNLNWTPRNQAAIQNYLKTYPFKSGDVAVFDADGTLWSDDVGEAFLRWLIKEKKLKNVDYSQDIYAGYENMCKTSKLLCYGHAVQVMDGLKKQDVIRWSNEFFKKEFVSKIFPSQKALIRQLEQKGVTVWIVSASHQWIVEAGSDYLGIPRSRVIGIRLHSAGDLLTNRLVQPVTYRTGKVEAINKYIQKQPVLVSGNSMTDYEMLVYSKGLRVVINPKDKGNASNNLAFLSNIYQWLVQKWK